MKIGKRLFCCTSILLHMRGHVKAPQMYIYEINIEILLALINHSTFLGGFCPDWDIMQVQFLAHPISSGFSGFHLFGFKTFSLVWTKSNKTALCRLNCWDFNPNLISTIQHLGERREKKTVQEKRGDAVPIERKPQ